MFNLKTIRPFLISGLNEDEKCIECRSKSSALFPRLSDWLIRVEFWEWRLRGR